MKRIIITKNRIINHNSIQSTKAQNINLLEQLKTEILLYNKQ